MNEELFPISQDIVFRKLYEDSPIMFRTVDLKGNILLCNKQYARNLGYTVQEIVGKSIFEHVAQQSKLNLQKMHDDWKKTGKILNQEIWFQRSNGTVFPTLINVSNLYDSDGKHIGSNTTIQDISDIYEYKNEIKTLQKQKLEVLGELCTRIAHDFRNPIHIIKNSIDLLENLSKPDETTLKYHRMIKKSTLRLTHQINDVLAFVNPTKLDIEKHSVLEILDHLVPNMNIPDTIHLTLPVNDIQIWCDKFQLEVVFTNLILNSIQAMNDVGKITIRVLDEGNLIRLEVQDNGPGIPPNLLSKIFDPLFTSRQVGTGLGLSSSKSIIENHGGTIHVNTKLGKGTTFFIQLPKIIHNNRT